MGKKILLFRFLELPKQGKKIRNPIAKANSRPKNTKLFDSCATKPKKEKDKTNHIKI